MHRRAGLAPPETGPDEKAGQGPPYEVPEGWTLTDLGHVADLVSGAGFPERHQGRTDLPYPFFKVGNLGEVAAGEYLARSPNTIDGQIARELRAKPIPPDSIVFAKIGMAIALNRRRLVGRECFIDNNVMAASPTVAILPRYLLRFLETVPFMPLAQATTVPSLRKSDLAEVPIPLPPLAEQRRIVAKVEELLTRVNAARERLSKVPVLVKRFRQSVLAAACSGRLTEEWRSRRTDDACGAPDLFEESDFPKGWTGTTLGELSSFVTSGSRGWAKYYSDGGPLFIRSQNINTDSLRLGDMAHVQPPKSAEGMRTSVRQGDLLITITGANVTKSALVDVEVGEAYVSQHVALIRLKESNHGRFLHLWTTSPEHGKAALLEDAYGAGKPGLNLDNLRDLSVTLPPREEQHEIVRRVQALFTLADAIEKRVVQGTARVEKTTQAILAKAFRGELVPTEAELARQEGRDYEPASVLLERIRAQREGGPAGVGASVRRSRKKAGPSSRRDAEAPRTAETEGLSELPPLRASRNIPEAILACLQPGREYSRSDLCEALGLSTTEWNWAIRQLKESGWVVQEGERRGARYSLARRAGNGVSA